MALHIHKSHEKNTQPIQLLGPVAKAYLITFGLALVTILSLVYPMIGLLSVGFFTLGVFAFLETRRHRQWETAYDFKLKHFRKHLNENIKDIKRLEGKVNKLSAHKGREKQMTSMQKKTDKIRSLYGTRPLTKKKPAHKRTYGDIFNLKTIPEFIIPKSHNTKHERSGLSVSNDRYFDDTPTFSKLIIQELLTYATQQDDIDVFVQPIVRLPARKIHFFEVFARLRAKPGLYVPGNQYLEIARQRQLQQKIDRLTLLRILHTIKNAPASHQVAPIFINIDSETLKDARFMRSLLNFVERYRDLTHKVVFELTYPSFTALSPGTLKILQELSKLGCSFSLDHLPEKLDEKQMDLETLIHFRIRYVKFHKNLFLGRKPHGAIRVKNKLEANGIAVIAEKIEKEQEVRDLHEYDIHYGQGFLFGKPELQGAYLPFTTVHKYKTAKSA